MFMRRLFIMRKDLHMSPGKLAAQVAHCAEAYWTRMLGRGLEYTEEQVAYKFNGIIDKSIVDEYLHGVFRKTICEARNKTHLLKAVDMAEELGLVRDADYGLIYDACFTELEPEEPDGTTLTGIWFRPLDEETAHSISKKYQLYRGEE